MAVLVPLTLTVQGFGRREPLGWLDLHRHSFGNSALSKGEAGFRGDRSKAAAVRRLYVGSRGEVCNIHRNVAAQNCGKRGNLQANRRSSSVIGRRAADASGEGDVTESA